jgi:hypothetical protein
MDMDLLNSPRQSTVSKFCDSKGSDFQAATLYILIKRHTINGGGVNTLLALAFRCLVLMYKVAICHPST